MMVCHLLGIGMVMGLSLGEPKLNFIFAKFGYGFEGEELKETLDEREALRWLKIDHKRPLNGN